MTAEQSNFDQALQILQGVLSPGEPIPIVGNSRPIGPPKLGSIMTGAPTPSARLHIENLNAVASALMDSAEHLNWTPTDRKAGIVALGQFLTTVTEAGQLFPDYYLEYPDSELRALVSVLTDLQGI